MVNVKVFSDFGCPYCYIATGIIDKLIEENVEFQLEWLPYESHPNVPLEGESLYKSFPKEQVDKMFIMLDRIGKPYGIKYGNVNKLFNTKKSLLVGEYAKSVGKYHEFSREVFKSIFVDMKNVGKENFLNEIALNVGLDIEEMNKLIDEGKYDNNLEEVKKLVDKYNIKEVPTFLINDELLVINVRNYERIKEAIVKAR